MEPDSPRQRPQVTVRLEVTLSRLDRLDGDPAFHLVERLTCDAVTGTLVDVDWAAGVAGLARYEVTAAEVVDQ